MKTNSRTMMLASRISLAPKPHFQPTYIANIESRFSNSTVNGVVPNQASPPGGQIAQAETLELVRQSHNILLKGIVEGNNDESIVTDIINHIEPTPNAHRVSIARLVTFLCSHVWGCAPKHSLKLLDCIQNRAVRLIDTPNLTKDVHSLEHRRRTYAGTAYVHRHNAALRVLYYHLRHSYGIDETPVLPYAPGDIESVVENERCCIYWNYSFPTLELVQANKPDIVLLDHQQKTMFVIEFSAPAEVNIVSKEEEKRTKYQELLGQLRRLWPDYTVSLLVMVIGSLGGMRNTLLSALRAIPVCRAAAHILAARMQKAVILGWTTELKDDLLSCYESSSPRRRGYMSRMYERWCEMHPEHSTLTSQNLRDYVSYLRRQGYVRAPAQPSPSATGMLVDQAEKSPIRPAEKEIDEVVSPGDFSDRMALHNIKRSFKLADLKREDEALGKRLSEVSDIWRINCEIYATALRLTRQERVRDSPVERAQRRVRQMEAKIQLARQEASQRKPFTRRVRRIAYGLRRDHHTLSQSVLVVVKQHCLDRIRMLMAAKRSLVAQARDLEENRMFSERPSRLFQQRPPVIEQPPTVDRVEAFWRDVYEQPKPLQADTPALAQFESVCRRTSNTNVLRHPINTEEIVGALRGAKNFAAPDPDGINTYWLKHFLSCHRHLARVFNSWLNQEQPIPAWFVEGRTVLLPKTGDLSDPKNYRPITCLNACYKLFTRILYTRILEAVNPVFLDVYEQRGSKKGVAGCKENLLIDRCVTQDSVQYKRNLSMAWIDYRKAFDTTSHELIVRLLECLSVDNQIVGCIKHLMPLWKTRFTITSGETRVRTELVSFKRGVFQGDSLSPLLFCISLLPLSIALKNTKGYSCGTPNHRRHKVTHLFYMDDLKLYASGQRDLQRALRVVQEYSHAIGMEFGTDKCAMVHLKKGRCGDSEEEEQLVDGSILRQLHAGDTYTYLGVAQRHVQEANTVKECLRRKYLHRLRQIWSSELSGKNKVAATNMLTVPLLLYTFDALHWTVDELRQIDTKTRKRMNMERSLHPKSSVPRIYLPRHLGGRGLLSLERLHNRVVLATACNVTRSNDPLIRFVREHENAGKGAFLFKAAKRAAEELSLTLDFTRRSAEVEFLLKLHKDKPMHGIFYKHQEEHGLSEQLTFSFLRSSGLESETEGFIMACQDGVVNTLVYRGRVMGMNVPDTSCRACRQAPETLMHLLSACKTYAGTAYVHRHNAALRVLYYHLRHSYGIDETPVLPYAPGDIESVVENERCRIYWNYSFPTLELAQANKPDIVLLDHQQKTMFVIEFSAPAEVNIVSKEEEKRTKYQELLGQLRRLWPDYTVSLLVMVIGSLGGMRNTLLSALRAIPVCRAAAHILAARRQKAVILGSLRLLRAHDTRTP
nr:unnamed protein product [Callosobruchus analis]